MPKDITQPLVQHIFNLKRVENSLAKETLKHLKQAELEAESLLRKMEIGEMKTFKGKKRRAERFLKEVRETMNTNFDKVGRVIRNDATRLARIESQFTTDVLRQATEGATDIRIVNASLSVPESMIKQIVELEPIDGLEHSKWLSGMKRSTLTEMRKRVQVGMISGETTDQIVRRIRGTRTNGFKDGLFQGPVKRSVERTVRTTTNHVSNRARLEVLRKNEDISKRFEYVATLDDRTTAICQSLDGKTFLYKNAQGVIPPLHPNCRSTIVPVIDWKGLGMEPPPDGLRASMKGPVSSKLKYNDWLKKQPKKLQDKILGPTRAKLFRAGKITLDDLVRKDGRMLTLEGLEKKLEQKPKTTVPKLEPEKPVSKTVEKLTVKKLVGKKKANEIAPPKNVEEAIQNLEAGVVYESKQFALPFPKAEKELRFKLGLTKEEKKMLAANREILQLRMRYTEAKAELKRRANTKRVLEKTNPTLKGEFKPVSDADFKKMKLPKNLTEEEFFAVNLYQAQAYDKINRFLRSNKAGEKFKGIKITKPKGKNLAGQSRFQELAHDVENALDKAKTKSNMLVYRGMPETQANKVLRELKPGSVFQDSGFVSTSVDPDIANKFGHGRNGSDAVIFEIRVPRGSNAVSTYEVAHIGIDRRYEKEILIQRNSKFRVVEREETKVPGQARVTRIVLELVK